MVLVEFMLPVGFAAESRTFHQHVSFLPRKDETVLFIGEDGAETEFTVKHVIHILEDREFEVQVVLR
jgi:hypothetical protein